MPAGVLQGELAAPAYAVLGSWEDGHNVCHVALLQSDERLRAGVEVGVLDVGPPIFAGQSSAPRRALAPDVFGWADLTPEQSEGIELWLEDVRTRLTHTPPTGLAAFDEYTVDPPYEEVVAETGVPLGWRFSCAGFVVACYRDGAEMPLVVEDRDLLPEVDLSVLACIWPLLAKLLRRKPALAAKMGVEGSGPWRLLLPAYVLHAFHEDSAKTGYLPRHGDWNFPRTDP